MLALDVWRWMGGWRPELMPMADFLFDLPDPADTQDRLVIISSLLPRL